MGGAAAHALPPQGRATLAVHPFAKDRADFDAIGQQAIGMLGEYLRALPTQPVDRVVPAEVRRRLMSLALPERGQSPEEILEFLRREIMPWPVAIGHRRSFAWVNSPPAPICSSAPLISPATGLLMAA